MKQIGLLLLLLIGCGSLSQAQNPPTRPLSDSQSTFRKVFLPLEIAISCEGQKYQLGWDFSTIDSALLPKNLILKGYRFDETDRVYFTDLLLDSSMLYFEKGVWISVPGHYYFEGIDSARKVSYASEEVLLEVCALFQLPASFTLGEGKYFKPIFNQNIERIELVIFDGAGQEVFSTRDPAFTWDGRNPISGELCSPGTYFYNCDVYERKGGRTVRRNVTGMIDIGY